ncbi:hypothetical protein [Pseudomonas phage Waldo5]|uniref:Uncharacterized protein n=1 Tax=Pseudomonas phage Waldo5 TaxID=2762290 RepID=A0A7G8LJN9_9CAUD|nr:hypothetical protein [Pseudomonas phage Waldo5]
MGAPVTALDPIMEALKGLVEKQADERIKEATTKAFLAGEKAGQEGLKGPHWESVKDLQGRSFSIMRARIPSHNKLGEYGSVHFMNKQFKCLEVRYQRSEEYTGYAVLFEFNLRPFTPEIVWLPLSACAFSR